MRTLIGARIFLERNDQVPLDLAEFQSDLEEIFEDWTDTFVWRGIEYRCLADRVRKSSESDYGGQSLDFTLTLLALVSVFDKEVPNLKQTLVFKEVTYTIVDKHESADGVQLLFDCERT